MKIKKYLNPVIKGLILWLIVFIASEILISGGKYYQNIYLIILNAIIIITYIWFYRSSFGEGIKNKIVHSGIITICFALLDFLVINLLLYQNNYSIYSSYSTYIYYGLILILPVIVNQLPSVQNGVIKKVKTKLPS